MRCSFCVTLLLSFACVAAAADKKGAISDPAEAAQDPDFAIQGEYIGSGHGLQVIALGGGKFQGVHLPGGLPGQGWDGQTRHMLNGKRNGSKTTFKGDKESSWVISGILATLNNANGDVLAQLKKVNRYSATLGLVPPAGATVLFDGTNTDQFEGGKITPDGHLQVGVTTKELYNDFRLHLEFRTPYMPKARGQQRGNSGVYVQRRYEVQILDSFGLEGKANEAGGLYRTKPADVNMALPPLQWQTYDIHFTAAKFDDDGKKTDNARFTVLHNGVPIHDDYGIKNKTGAGRPEGPNPMPIHLQNHGNPVVFRNIWIVDTTKSAEESAEPSACGCGANSCGTGTCGATTGDSCGTFSPCDTATGCSTCSSGCQ